ncbi:F0F1 ATP synthase subunit A [Dokdonia sp. Hel_I_53]|uniref:F0F1 ATP synthase subunit A n=1 Tax=Dokdonia sp. Hel_I_53 TaxID=1566287 RepID=UPI0011995078|nr:F0F1 ATP synthase subunit A [Dokdonia sp. Hel_I_53]TVZ52703.1 ATP synthase F0 subcomplex A subunit [Dokdonia sp. Hel_I_53]
MKVALKSITFLTLFVVLSIPLSSFAKTGPTIVEVEETASEGTKGDPVNTSSEVKEYIQHHLRDSHDFHLFSYFSDNGEEHHVGFPLPVMLWGENGFTAFMSSRFHHDDNGQVVVEENGGNFVKLHGKIYELNAGETAVQFDEDHHAINASKPFDLSITKSVLGILVIGLLMLLWFSGLARQYKNKQVPTGFGRVLEPLVIYVRDEIAKPNIGDQYRKFTGYLLTVFFFIWILNLVGLMPFGFNVTGQIAVTAALAVITLVIYVVSGNKHFWGHMLWMPGIPYVFRPFLGIIELVGTLIIKPFSLLVRLFANITAGHTVVMSLIAVGILLQDSLTAAGSTIVSLLLSGFIMLIELLVAFLQAYIFTTLSALFIGMAVADDHHDEELHDATGEEIEDTEVIRKNFT